MESVVYFEALTVPRVETYSCCVLFPRSQKKKKKLCVSSRRSFDIVATAIEEESKMLNAKSSINLHGLTYASIFHNCLNIKLSPLKSPVLRKYSNLFLRPGMNPTILKYNA